MILDNGIILPEKTMHQGRTSRIRAGAEYHPVLFLRLDLADEVYRAKIQRLKLECY
jgi:hypothetical protein